MKPEGNYIDAYYDRKQDTVVVWERVGKERQVKRYPAPYYFYFEDANGEYTSIYGKKLSRFDAANKNEFEAAKKRHTKLYESDISPMDKILMNHYYQRDTPDLNYTLLDIEVDYNRDKGFASPENPYAPINAVTVWHQWLNKYITIAIPPPIWKQNGWGMEKISDEVKAKTDIRLAENEAELIKMMMEILEDTDVISGWNSEFFDLPYMVKRTEIVLGRAIARRWSRIEGAAPKFSEVEKFGKAHQRVAISGRQHLDYLELFKKFTFEGRQSYSLANIADEECPDVPKISYTGSLEGLYQNDFNFFILYNIRDVEVLEALDDKFKFISLANELGHVNTVILPKVLGSVHPIDCGIMNFVHHELGLIVGDKVHKVGNKIKGAMVMTPKVGLHDWIGSIDINSLYPSVYRTLNISPEMIIGQFTCFDDDWEKIYARTGDLITLKLEDNTTIETTASEWHDILEAKQWAVSAYGTVFDQSKGDGFIPQLLADWYAKRVEMKGTMKKHIRASAKMVEGSPEHIAERKLVDFWDRKQHTYKILLNSLYGATINEWCRFYDPRLGASTTSTGRQITKHMTETAGELITGEFHPVTCRQVVKPDGKIEDVYECESEAIIYGDTDSVYFATLVDDEETAIAIADIVGVGVNDSFPPFMQQAFLARDDFKDGIQCGREIVGKRAIFQAKKRYVIWVIDDEGEKKDKLKAMGSEIKKSDTPKPIQKFLKNVIDQLMRVGDEKAIEKYVNDFRETIFKPETLFSIGITRGVNNLEKYYKEYCLIEKTGKGKVRIPGHVRAAINHNEQIIATGDKYTAPIQSGDKVKVYYLKPNEMGYTSICISGDATDFPPWWDKIEVDLEDMEFRLIDKKLGHTFTAIGWDVPTLQNSLTSDFLEF